MAKKEDIRRYTASELDAMRRKGLSQTDWAKVKAMTEEELEASIAADPDDIHEPLDWTKAIKGLPPRKTAIKLRIDDDVLGWFKATGKGYQTRMNNVLRAYFESRGGRTERGRALSRPGKKVSPRAKQERRRRA
jgi:uncharacterized protein (DUF4415 family)